MKYVIEYCWFDMFNCPIQVCIFQLVQLKCGMTVVASNTTSQSQ